jgi:hypothetical protein
MVCGNEVLATATLARRLKHRHTFLIAAEKYTIRNVTAAVGSRTVGSSQFHQ